MSAPEPFVPGRHLPVQEEYNRQSIWDSEIIDPVLVDGEVAVLNLSKQYPICIGYCDRTGEDLRCDYRLRFYDSESNDVASKRFRNVPARSSRQLAYSGGKSPIWCELKQFVIDDSCEAFCEGNWNYDVDANILLVDKNSGEVEFPRFFGGSTVGLATTPGPRISHLGFSVRSINVSAVERTEKT
ncbi:MAG: hypothetical protein GY708_24475 [Actinomycetia bacterium]|nr:hypothetical protein [Actinomycetes bacterium]